MRGRKGIEVFERDELDVRDEGRLGVELADEEARKGTPLVSSVVGEGVTGDERDEEEMGGGGGSGGSTSARVLLFSQRRGS